MKIQHNENEVDLGPSFSFAPTPPCTRPRQLVEVRDWAADQWSFGDFRKATQLGVFGNSGDDDVYADAEARGLARASLFWMTNEMCDLLNSVAAGMPNDVELNEALLIDRDHACGFVWFEKPMIGHDAHNGTDIRIDALLWNPIDYPYYDKIVPGIGLSWYQLDEEIGVLLPLGRSDWIRGTTIDDDSPVRLGVEEGFIKAEWKDTFLQAAIEDRKAFASILALSTQANLSTVEHDHLDRATRRRRERQNRPSSSVRIVRLRGSESHTGPSEGTSERHYSHRWTVDAHWRNQAYGPNRSLRRPTLIAPYIKGPKDAPLIVKDKVRVIG